VVLERIEVSAENKDGAIHTSGPTFRRLRVLFRTTPFVWNPETVVKGRIHPLKEAGWSTLLTWPPKKQLGATPTSLPPPVFDLATRIASDSVRVTMNFRDKPLRIKISRKGLAALLSVLDGIPQLTEAILGPSPQQPPQNLSLDQYVVDNYAISSTSAPAPAAVAAAAVPHVAPVAGPVFIVDERGRQSGDVHRDDPDVVPPLPPEIIEGIQKAKLSPASQGGSGGDGDSEDDGDDVFFDAEDFSQPNVESSTQTSAIATNPATTSSPKKAMHVFIEATGLCLELQFIQTPSGDGDDASHSKARYTKLVHVNKDSVLFRTELRHCIVELSPPDTTTLFRARLALAALRADSDVTGSSWGPLLYVDEDRLQTWRRRNPGEVLLPDVATLLVNIRQGNEAATKLVSIRAACQPLRISLMQATLSFLLSTIDVALSRQSVATTAAPPPPPKGREPQQMLVDELRISPIGLRLDYKPQPERGIPTVKLGGFIWALRLMPSLTGTRLKLPEICRTPQDVPLPASELASVFAASWTPGIPQVLVMAESLKPVHVIVKLAGGAASVVKMPIDQYREDGDVLKGLSRGFQTMAVEFLDVGSKATLSVVRLLRLADEAVAGECAPSAPVDPMDSLADTPATLREGATSAWRKFASGISGALQGVAFQPVREYCHTGTLGYLGGLARNVPGLLIRPVAGAAEAVTQVLLAARNTVDPSVRSRDQAFYRRSSTEVAATERPLGLSDFEEILSGEDDLSSSQGATASTFVPLQTSTTSSELKQD